MILEDGEVTSMLFNAMVVEVLLYRVDVWGASISRRSWNQNTKNTKSVIK